VRVDRRTALQVLADRIVDADDLADIALALDNK